MKDNLVIKVKHSMNSDEINKWREGDFLKSYRGTYRLKQWEIYIGECSIIVIGYNGLKFGHLELDHGIFKDSYYPKLCFYNQLSCTSFGYDISDNLCTEVKYAIKNNKVVITLHNIIEAVEESWNKIRDFLNQ